MRRREAGFLQVLGTAGLAPAGPVDALLDEPGLTGLQYQEASVVVGASAGC